MMEKRILLIGNNADLPGVKQDFINYQYFFKNKIGGDWYDEEIIQKMNPTKYDLLSTISKLRSDNLDYIVVIYSGHGGQERETVLEINEKGERIDESELKDISKRQLTIYDCCRAYSSMVKLSESTRITAKSFDKIDFTRQLYENRIMESIQQQVNLYACSIGEIANDTSEGGAYSKNLLKAAQSVQYDFMTVGHAHSIAKETTQKEFPRQNPDAILPRCFSERQLILSINPNH
jgi:hypothetical protein